MSQAVVRAYTILSCLDELAVHNMDGSKSASIFLRELCNLYKTSELAASKVQKTLHSAFRESFRNMVHPTKFVV